jgi:hypothetical protein
LLREGGHRERHQPGGGGKAADHLQCSNQKFCAYRLYEGSVAFQ